MLSCLILNADYSPFEIVTWKDAFLMLYSESKSAYPIEYYNKSILDGSGKKHPVPSVMVLKNYINTNHHDARYSKYSKLNVFSRDDYTCMYCGIKFPRSELTIDHVVPRSRCRQLGYKGRVNSLDNVVTACFKCNIKKGNYTVDECKMYPLRHPRKITRRECLMNKIRNMTIPQEWETYLNV